MNFVREIVIPTDDYYRQTGRCLKQVMVPRWRKQEMMAAVAELFPTMYPCEPLTDCDFHFPGLKGNWWDRDYIEYRT